MESGAARSDLVSESRWVCSRRLCGQDSRQRRGGPQGWSCPGNDSRRELTFAVVVRSLRVANGDECFGTVRGRSQCQQSLHDPDHGREATLFQITELALAREVPATLE